LELTVLAFRLGLLAALAAVTSWGGMFTIMSHLLASLDPYWLTSIRYVFAAAILAVALLVVEGPAAFRLDSRAWLLIGTGAAGIAGFNLFLLNGLERSSAEHCALLAALAPAMVTLIVWARSKITPSRVTLGMLGLAFIGVALVVTKGRASALLSGSSGGDGLIALGVLGFAIYTAGAPLFADWSRLRFTALSIGFGTIVTLAVSAIATACGVAHPPHSFDAWDLGGMLYLIFIAAVFALTCWSFAISSIGAQNAALFLNAVPIVAFIIGIFQGRHFSAVEYGGALLTILALVLNNALGRDRGAAPVGRLSRAA
jgi:drug/metabolite transporter (DMT)-like permease